MTVAFDPDGSKGANLKSGSGKIEDADDVLDEEVLVRALPRSILARRAQGCLPSGVDMIAEALDPASIWRRIRQDQALVQEKRSAVRGCQPRQTGNRSESSAVDLGSSATMPALPDSEVE